MRVWFYRQFNTVFFGFHVLGANRILQYALAFTFLYCVRIVKGKKKIKLYKSRNVFCSEI